MQIGHRNLELFLRRRKPPEPFVLVGAALAFLGGFATHREAIFPLLRAFVTLCDLPPRKYRLQKDAVFARKRIQTGPFGPVSVHPFS